MPHSLYINPFPKDICLVENRDKGNRVNHQLKDELSEKSDRGARHPTLSLFFSLRLLLGHTTLSERFCA